MCSTQTYTIALEDILQMELTNKLKYFLCAAPSN